MRLFLMLMSTVLAAPKTTKKTLQKTINGHEKDIADIEKQMVRLEKSVQDNLNDLHDNHKMMISMKSASDKSKAVAEDVEKLSDDINFETLHINKEGIDREANDNLLLGVLHSLMSTLKNDDFSLESLMNSVDVIGLVKEKVINMKFESDMDYASKETSKRAEDLSKNADTLNTLENLKDKMQQLEFDIIVEGTKREKLFENLSRRLRQPVGQLIDDGKNLKKSGKMKGFGYNPLEEDGRVRIDTDGDGKWDAVRYKMDDEGNVHYIGDAAYEIAEEIGSFRANITDQLDTMTNTVVQVIDHMGESERQVELDHQYMEQEMNHTTSELEYGFDGMRDDLNLIYNFTEAIFQNGSFYTDTLQNLQSLVYYSPHQVVETKDDLKRIEAAMEMIKSSVLTIATEKIEEKQKLLSKAEKVKLLEDKIASVEYDLKQPPQEGDIILTGGLGVSGFNSTVGDVEHGILRNTTVISPKGRTARNYYPMDISRTGHCAVNYDGEVYVIGGGEVSTTKFDRRAGEWSATGQEMIDVHDFGPGCTVFQDRIWVCGGHDSFNASFTCESYGKDDGWREEEPLLNPQFATTMAATQDEIFLIGGTDFYGDYSIVQRYYNGVWDYFASLPFDGIKYASAISFNEDIYVVGGYGNEKNILKLDYDHWEVVATLNTERVRPSLIPMENRIWIVGGVICGGDVNCQEEVEVFIPRSQTIKSTTVKGLPETNYGAAVIV